MIYHMPSTVPNTLLVASTLNEEGPAENEIAQWAVAHGYQPPHDARTIVFYDRGTPTRAWRIIQRQPSVSDTEH